MNYLSLTNCSFNQWTSVCMFFLCMFDLTTLMSRNCVFCFVNFICFSTMFCGFVAHSFISFFRALVSGNRFKWANTLNLKEVCSINHHQKHFQRRNFLIIEKIIRNSFHYLPKHKTQFNSQKTSIFKHFKNLLPII